MIELSGNDLIFFILTSSALLLILAGFFFIFIQLYQRKQFKFKMERKQREQEFAKELIHVQLEIREELMQKLSSEIHDNIGQSLVVAKLQLNSVIQEQSLEQAGMVEELISRSISDLRDLSKTLNGEYILRTGIHDAIEKEVHLIDQIQSLGCTLEGEFPKYFLSPDSEIILFRCIQETLSNCIKHSEANQIDVRIAPNKHELKLTVTDNGVGMPDNWEKNRGLGIENIRKRVELLNGKVSISNPHGGGTRISIILPKTNNQQIEQSENRNSR